ncbi:ThiF family adenylyltransferase [bacterium]|nr:ThiF family adenylyltransferase [candidate division CSSED10-310 bacterium]
MIDRDRYSRLLAIPDYPADKVINSLIIVGGVGALGNELVKNLCLLGFRHIFVVDLDRVEPSNLTRSVLFREADCGQPKVAAAAKGGKEINKETNFYIHDGDIADVGLGVFRRASLIFSDFDDLYPRYIINAVATKLGKVWIDAYLGFKPYGGGVAVYDGADARAPCYVCHTGIQTYRETFNTVQDREGCQVKERDRTKQGFLPTTPTTCSVIAGLQAQAGLHYLLMGNSPDNQWLSKLFHLDILTVTSRIEKSVTRSKCPFHPPADRIISDNFVSLNGHNSSTTRLSELFQIARENFPIQKSNAIYLQLSRQMVLYESCMTCQREIERFQSVVSIVRDRKKGRIALCPYCGSETLSFHPLYGVTTLLDESMPFQSYSLKQLGLPSLDILTILEEKEDDYMYYFLEMNGDCVKILPGFSSVEV